MSTSSASPRLQTTALRFEEEAEQAIADPQLQRALQNVKTGFIAKRAKARAGLPEFDALRHEARAIKEHTLAHLDLYLEAFEDRVRAQGGKVHYAADSEAARQMVLSICRAAGAQHITKGKSMVSEEIGLDPFLAGCGFDVVETDLGEYIIQLRHEAPSHIIAPVIHLNKEEVAADFRRVHTQFPPDRPLDTPAEIVAEARTVLRQKFVAADVGITGANLLVAETGSAIVVTNEGNGDLTMSLPRTHIVLATIEKLVPTLEDASTILRVLARSATGQELTSYTTFATGARREGDPDGPASLHVVLLDNGRAGMLGGDFEDMLRCIRCGACLNHCPVYAAVGGHAYGSVYPGPMGAVLTPQLAGIGAADTLPNASSFCGRCESVCPVEIPLPGLMRKWRERDFEAGNPPLRQRLALKAWALLARHPQAYRFAADSFARLLAARAGRKGRLSRLPFGKGWTGTRDFPAPQGETFQALYRRSGKGVDRRDER